MTSSRFRRRRSALAALAAGGLAVGAGAGVLAPGTAMASSHREAPLIATDGQVDNTDLYAFVSPDKSDTVTLVANVNPLEDPAGGPNFYPFATDARYNINIDNDGDAKPDVTYRYTFKTSDKRGQDTFLYNNGPVTSLGDANLLFKQTYKLQKIVAGGATTTLISNGKVAPSDVGDGSMPNYASLRNAAVSSLSGGGKSFAGQADDPFFVDLRVFDLLYGGDLSETGADTLDGFNVNTLALQVPISDLTKGSDPTVGVWTTTERPGMRVQKDDGTQNYSGGFVQVSRLGNPLVNEAVIPSGLKDAFNALKPENDSSVQPAVDRVNDPEVPKLIEKIYGIKAPKAPRDDLFSVFLTGVSGLNKPKGTVQPAELLRLNTSIKPTANPNRLGVLAKDNQGFPNGRRLTDDVVDIEVQALEGAVRTGKIVQPLAKGDGVDTNDKAFGHSFPYVALPHSGSKVRPGSTSSAQEPNTGANAGGGGTADLASTMPLGSNGFAGRQFVVGAAASGGLALTALLVVRRRRRTVVAENTTGAATV